MTHIRCTMENDESGRIWCCMRTRSSVRAYVRVWYPTQNHYTFKWNSAHQNLCWRNKKKIMMRHHNNHNTIKWTGNILLQVNVISSLDLCKCNSSNLNITLNFTIKLLFFFRKASKNGIWHLLLDLKQS